MEMKFGEILERNRKRVGITQDELVSRVKETTGERIERTYMSKLESDKSNPSFSTIWKICEGLGMTLAEFFGEAEKDLAAIFVRPEKIKQVKEEEKVRSEMIQIRVFDDINVFSLDKDIQKEFPLRYTFVEKQLLFPPKEHFKPKFGLDKKFYERIYSNNVGLDTGPKRYSGYIRARIGSILIVHLIKGKLALDESPTLCIVDMGDGEGPELKKVVKASGYIAFFDPEKEPYYQSDTFFSKEEDFDYTFIRGTIF